MEVNDDVLRSFLKFLSLKQRVQLMRMSKQFKRVLDDMFAKQKKLSLGSSHSNLCSARDNSHQVSVCDVLPVSRSVHNKKTKTLFAIKSVLRRCRSLEVIFVTLECSKILQFEGLLTLSRRLMSRFRNKIVCLAIDSPQFKFTRMHRMSRLMHLRTYKVTAKAKKFLIRRNPDIYIHEGSVESLQNPMIPLANLELHDHQQGDNLWGEIPEINFQDLLVGFGPVLGGGDNLE